jgi:hypothetical protein
MAQSSLLIFWPSGFSRDVFESEAGHTRVVNLNLLIQNVNPPGMFLMALTGGVTVVGLMGVMVVVLRVVPLEPCVQAALPERYWT